MARQPASKLAAIANISPPGLQRPREDWGAAAEEAQAERGMPLFLGELSSSIANTINGTPIGQVENEALKLRPIVRLPLMITRKDLVQSAGVDSIQRVMGCEIPCISPSALAAHIPKTNIRVPNIASWLTEKTVPILEYGVNGTPSIYWDLSGLSPRKPLTEVQGLMFSCLLLRSRYWYFF